MSPRHPFLRHLMLALTLGGWLTGCTTKTTTDEEATVPSDSVILNDPASDELNSNQSALLNTILGDSDDDGVLRGIAFGDPVGKVRATEKFELFEDSLSHAGYTYETEQLETIDVLYYFSPKARQVDKITVDVYLNSETATRQLWNSAKRRFTGRYGEPGKEISHRIEWKKDPVKVTLQEVSDGKDYGVKMIFEPTNKTALALK